MTDRSNLKANQSGSERAGVDALREALVNGNHYLCAIRQRLERLYEEHPNDGALREHISDEVDWIDGLRAALATPPAQPAPASNTIMTDDQIKYMVDRFLGWKLPENFNPDGGVSFEQFGNVGTEHQYKRQLSGTNLFDATQATDMVRYIIDGMSALQSKIAAAETSPGDVAVLPKRPFAFAVRRAPENGADQWRLFMDESEARAEAEQLDGDYECLFRVGDRRSAVDALMITAQIASAVRVWLECPAEKRPSAQALGIRVAEIAAFDREERIGAAETPFYGAKCPSYPNCTGGCGLGCTHEIENRKPRVPPEWLWWGEVDGKDVVTFGRWPKRGAQWRYKLADVQPTEHDKQLPDEKYKAAWDAYVEASMCPGVKTFDCIKRAVDAALSSKIAAAETSPGDVKPEAPAVSVDAETIDAVARIIDPTAWKMEHGYWMEQAHAYEAISKAIAIAALIDGER